MIAAAYARFSSDNQRQASIDAQLRAIRQHVERMGYDLAYTYTDEAISGKTDDRSAFLRMMQDAHAHRFDVIIVHEFSRAFRNAKDSAVYRDELRRLGVRIVSVLEPVEDSPIGRFMETIIAGKDQMYSEHLAIETMKGLKENAYSCTFCGGRAPLGYDVVDQKYVINEREAVTVRRIFEMYAAGATYNSILNALVGAVTKGGAPFGKNSLNSILTNEKYAGTFTFNVRSYGAGKRRNPDEDIIRVPGGIPPIIDRETWRLVSDRMKDNRRNGAGKAKREYLLSGVVTCGVCGGSVCGRAVAKGGTGVTYTYYACKNRCFSVRQERLESVISARIVKLFDADLEETTESLYAMQEEDSNADEVRRLLVRNKKEVDGLISAIASGAYHPAMNARLEDLRREEQQLHAMQRETKKYTRQQIRAAIEAYRNFADFSPEMKKRAIRTLVSNVTLNPDGKGTLSFSIPRVAGEGLEPTTFGL